MSFQSESNEIEAAEVQPTVSSRARRFLTLLLVVVAVSLGLTLGGVYDLAPDSYAQSTEGAVKVTPSNVSVGLPASSLSTSSRRTPTTATQRPRLIWSCR